MPDEDTDDRPRSRNSRPLDLPWPTDVIDAIRDLRRRQAVRNARRRERAEATR